jgi:LysM repeat protein
MENNQSSSRKSRLQDRKNRQATLRAGVIKFTLLALTTAVFLIITYVNWPSASKEIIEENDKLHISGNKEDLNVKKAEISNENEDAMTQTENDENELNETNIDEQNDEVNEDVVQEEHTTKSEEDNLTETTSESENSYTIHIVKSGETIYKISMHYYNSREGEKLIKDFNDLKNNEIYVGQKLKIPQKNRS